MVISNQQFSDAYDKLPLAIREFLASNDLGTIVQSIGAAHGLHVDTMGALKRETTNMLLGYVNPTQLVGELKSVGIPEASIGAIVEELNTKVFIPLREKMKNPSNSADEEDEDTDSNIETLARPQALPQVPQAPVVTPSTPPIIATPVAPVIIASPPQVIVASQAVPLISAPVIPAPQPYQPPAITYAAPPVVSPPPAPSYMPPAPRSSVSEFSSVPPLSMPAPATPPANIVAPHPRTMQEDMQILKASPHDAPLTAPVRPPAYTQPPVRPLATMPTPPAQSAPIASPTQAPSTRPLPRQNVLQTSAAPSASRDALHAVLKEYGVDPYREPAE